MDTRCKKCNLPCPYTERTNKANGKMIITGFYCKACGHWNNFKRRKGYKDWMRSMQANLELGGEAKDVPRRPAA